MSDLPPENVQQYPRPPRIEPVPHLVVVRLGGETIAETTGAFRVLETHHAPSYYLPPEDVRARLDPVAGGSFCEWKGRARYFDVSAGGQRAPRAAWSYDAPSARFADLAGYLAFYAGLMEACFVGSERVIPQDGDFYGGWVTRNLTGRIKGARGTEHW
ncbi:uncharacterized protein (DUF427 family) [Palleronia aestuarii]|uniref:Uncharacterized protein (DUF427 family) n=1 Tax=Palleronia aestuarii TaxID=568105 RepID=A0A2W7NUI8_9RHOB|nr:DUF427 domain-containing protein [Palleronia aestuarii]PZX17006.1 uncharacterized protein (DUF427 family) [Palleronia aestuarii]